MSESVAIATEAQSSTKAKNRARKRVPYVGLGFISIFLIVVILAIGYPPTTMITGIWPTSHNPLSGWRMDPGNTF